MARQSLTTPSLICVNVQLLPSTTATSQCYIFSSLVQSNNTPTDLYLTLLSSQHKYHTQMPLPHNLSTTALKDALRQPEDGSGGTTFLFQLHEDKAAAAAAGHAAADAMLYIRKERRDKRAWLTVPLSHVDSHRSDRLLQDLQKLFQRLQETVAQHEAAIVTRAADIRDKLTRLQIKTRRKQAMEDDMAQCTLLLLREKQNELARCEKEYAAALRARREARSEKAKKERDERRQSPSAEVLDGPDDETDSELQTTSEDEEEAESELSRLNDPAEDNTANSDDDAVMHEEEQDELQHEQQEAGGRDNPTSSGSLTADVELAMLSGTEATTMVQQHTSVLTRHNTEAISRECAQ